MEEETDTGRQPGHLRKNGNKKRQISVRENWRAKNSHYYTEFIKEYCVSRVDSIADNDMNSVHYLLFIPFHIGSAEIEKAAKVRKFKDFHESVRRSPIIVSTCGIVFHRFNSTRTRMVTEFLPPLTCC